MKKSLLALAVLATTGAAFAQSSVTLYGRVDLGITKTTGSSAAMTDGSAIGGGASRIGLRGVEDLGGGLKAGFLVEAGYSADANNGATTFGSRNSYIDLTGGFGTVRLGRHLNPALLFVGTYSAFGTDYGQASGSNILNIEGARYNNALSYMGKFGPVSVMATTAMKEADTFAVNNLAGTGAVGATKNPLALLVGYGAGPVSAHLAVTTNGRSGKKALTQLGASYNFGPATAMVAFEQNGNQAKKNAYSVGVRAPMGATTLLATYGKDDSSGNTQVAGGASYALSKRTAAYGVVAQLKPAGGTAKTQINLGVGHNF